MAYTTADGQRELLTTTAAATDALGRAIAALGVAYEELDEARGDALEEQLFRPVQAAYGRLRRSTSEFAGRHELEEQPVPAAPEPAAWHGARSLVEDAVAEVGAAEDTLTELQDSLLPVEVGDPELRAGIAAVREVLAPLQDAGADVVRMLWR